MVNHSFSSSDCGCRRVSRFAIIALALALTACGSEPASSTMPARYAEAPGEQDVPALDHQNFEDIGATSECTDDCSGHDAGFEWAKDHDILDSSNCGGKSQSFIEGCEAYAEAAGGEVDDDESSHRP